MIIKREKYFLQEQGIYLCTMKRTMYLLFGFIPLFISYEVSEMNFVKHMED